MLRYKHFSVQAKYKLRGYMYMHVHVYVGSNKHMYAMSNTEPRPSQAINETERLQIIIIIQMCNGMVEVLYNMA